MAQEKWLISPSDNKGAKIIDIESVSKLKIGLAAGQIDIIGRDEPGARIEVHSVYGRDLKISLDGDTLEIDHPQLRWDTLFESLKSFTGAARADISITVQRDVALKFGVATASALISGLSADASISTVSGDLVIDSMHGNLQLNAVNGEISVRNQVGAITAHSINGDITVSGEMAKFTADTVSGDVFADLTGVSDEVRVNTITGSVTTRLAADAPARYRINTVSGRLHIDESEISGVRGGYTGRYGTLDKKWLEFAANTVSGNISVLHAVSA
jgi:DUF4097 and DUF4098 domain-containing protein YvlB